MSGDADGFMHDEARAMLDRADEHMGRHEYVEAIDSFKLGFALMSPQDHSNAERGHTLVLLGMAYLQAGQHAELEQAAVEALEIFGDDPALGRLRALAHDLLGRYCALQSDMDRAVFHYREAITLSGPIGTADETVAMLYYRLGTVQLAGDQQTDDARHSLQAALDLLPQLQRFDRSRGDIVYALGLASIDFDRPAGLHLMREALRLLPIDDVSLWQRRNTALSHLGDPKLEHDEYARRRAAVRREVEAVNVSDGGPEERAVELLRLAGTLIELKDSADAERTALRASALLSGESLLARVDAHRLSGIAVGMQGRYVDALEHFERALTGLKDQADRGEARAQVLMQIGKVHLAANDTKRARVAFEAALDQYISLRNHPIGRAQAYTELGAIHTIEGRFLAARSVLLHAWNEVKGDRALVATQARIMANLGAMQFARGVLQASSTQYKHAATAYRLAALPDDADALGSARAHVLRDRALATNSPEQRRALLLEGLELALIHVIVEDRRRFRIEHDEDRITWTREVVTPPLERAVEITRLLQDPEAVATALERAHAERSDASATPGEQMSTSALDMQIMMAAHEPAP